MSKAVDGKLNTRSLTFSHLELAQAATFLLAVQQSEGGLIKDPLSMLQFRYAINLGHAQALMEQLEQIGFWVVFTDEDSTQCALMLRR